MQLHKVDSQLSTANLLPSNIQSLCVCSESFCQPPRLLAPTSCLLDPAGVLRDSPSCLASRGLPQAGNRHPFMLPSACSCLMAASAAEFFADLLLVQISPCTTLLHCEAPRGRKMVVRHSVPAPVVLYQA